MSLIDTLQHTVNPLPKDTEGTWHATGSYIHVDDYSWLLHVTWRNDIVLVLLLIIIRHRRESSTLRCRFLLFSNRRLIRYLCFALWYEIDLALNLSVQLQLKIVKHQVLGHRSSFFKHDLHRVIRSSHLCQENLLLEREEIRLQQSGSSPRGRLEL